MNELIYFLFIFIFSACWGSFLHLCIIRIPKKESIIFPSSHCLYCNKALSISDNIPLLGWAYLKGKCKYCGKKIGLRYFLTESIATIVFSCLFYVYFFEWVLIPYFLFCSLLIIGSGIDFDEYWIPDTVTIGSILLGLIFSIIMPQLHGFDSRISALIASFTGLFVGSGTLLIIGVLGKLLLKRDSMGMGDIKLLGAIGAVLGWEAVLFTIFIGSIIAVVISFLLILMKNKSIRDEVPFGPYLSIASILWILSGIDILKNFTDSLFLY